MSSGDTPSSRNAHRRTDPEPQSARTEVRGSSADEPVLFTVYLALGANLGDRQRQMKAALDALDAYPDVVVREVSDVYETTPVDTGTDHGEYLNAAARVETRLSPAALLRLTQSIERLVGRDPARRGTIGSARSYVPRPIDIDILLYESAGPGAEVSLCATSIVSRCGTSEVSPCDTPILPHPRMHVRAFVLRPLADIAPGLVHPSEHRTIAELLADLPDATDPRPRSVPNWWRLQTVESAPAEQDPATGARCDRSSSMSDGGIEEVFGD